MEAKMSVGDAVLDGYKQTASWFDNGVEWLGDLIDFYKERAAIEREASNKLASLTSKHFSKKASVSAAVSVGDEPLTTPGSLENTSLQAWMETLNQTEQMARERRKLSEEFTLKVSDELSSVRSRFEDLAKNYKKFHDNLEESRDKTYHQLKKSKQHYDATCESMESARAKSKKSVEAKETEMYNAKNSYLIQVNVSNRMKDKYYHDDIPEVLDAIQRANEARVAQTNRLIALAGNLEKARLQNCINELDESLAAVANNDPKLDTAMFVEHNANAYQWRDPTDFFFEPSPIWHDNDEMYTKSEEALRYLGALLSESNMKSVNDTAVSEKALQIYEQAKKGVASANFAELPPNQASPLLRTEAASLQKLVEAESNRLQVEVEIEALEAATASVDMSHVPQTRVKKHRTIFGKKKEVVEVVKDGKSSGHTHRSLGLTSMLARTSLGGGRGAGDDGTTKAQVLYNFESGGPGELSVSAGSLLELVEGDDGSGWVKLRGASGEGIVPASYVEILFGGRQAGGGAAAPPPPPTRGSQERKMIALYDFESGGPDQLDLHTNDSITVVEADTGNGWTTGVINGVKGIFPTSYARPA